jgi:hypothetical protein
LEEGTCQSPRNGMDRTRPLDSKSTLIFPASETRVRFVPSRCTTSLSNTKACETKATTTLSRSFGVWQSYRLGIWRFRQVGQTAGTAGRAGIWVAIISLPISLRHGIDKPDLLRARAPKATVIVLSMGLVGNDLGKSLRVDNDHES